MNDATIEASWRERTEEFVARNTLLMHAILFLVIAVVIYIFDPLDHFARDWDWFYRPAALALLRGQDVYSVEGFSAPPWSVLPLIPFALLPTKLSYCAYIACAIVVSAYTVGKYSGNRWSVLICLLSPFYAYMFIQGNIDWLALFAFVLPAPIAIVVATVKPQVAIVLLLYWLIVSYRDGGIRRVAINFLPLAVTTALAFLLFGNWPVKMLAITGATSGENVLWPYSIPIAGVLLYRLFKTPDDQEKKNLSAIVSPLVSPYVQFYSWLGVALGLSRQPVQALIFVVATWGLIIYRAIAGIPGAG